MRCRCSIKSVAPARLVAEQFAHFGERDRVDRTPLSFAPLFQTALAAAGALLGSRSNAQRDAARDVDRAQPVLPNVHHLLGARETSAYRRRLRGIRWVDGIEAAAFSDGVSAGS
jgi:hypothetical protein